MSKRFILVGLFSIVAFIGAMVAGLLALRPDASQAKEEFTRMFEDATGCHLQVASVQPDGVLLPAIRMSGLTLFNGAGAEVGQLRWLQADLSLSMLASGKLGLTHLHFVEPVVDVSSFQDCFKNIQIEKVEKSEFPNSFDVEIENGRLLWADNPFDQTFELENVSLLGNWDGQRNLRLEGSGSKKSEELYDTIPIKTSVRFNEKGSDRFRFEAFDPLSEENSKRIINFVMRPNLDDTVVSMGEGRLTFDLPEAGYLPIFKGSPLEQWPLSLSTDFSYISNNVMFERLEGRIDDENFTGNMNWEGNSDSIAQLHLDLKLGLLSRVKNLTNFTFKRGLKQLSNISGKLARLPFELDLGINASGISSVSGELARAPALHFTAGLGSVTLDQMNITLPGETEVSLLADFVPNEGAENSWFASGGLSIQSTNLKRSLKWLDIDSSNISPDQLRHFQMNAGLELDSNQFRISDLDLTFDSTDVNGDIEWMFPEQDNQRPNLQVALAVGTMNFDRMFSYENETILASLVNGSETVMNLIEPWNEVRTKVTFEKLDLAGLNHDSLDVVFEKTKNKISTTIENVKLASGITAGARLSSDWNDGPPVLDFDVNLRAKNLIQFVSSNSAASSVPLIKSIGSNTATISVTGKGTPSSIDTNLSVDAKSIKTNIQGPLQISLLSKDGPSLQWLINNGYADLDGNVWSGLKGHLSYDSMTGFSLTDMHGDLHGGQLGMDVIENSKKDLNVRMSLDKICPEIPIAEFGEWMAATACISGQINGVLGVSANQQEGLTNYASGNLFGTFNLDMGDMSQRLPDGMATRLINNLANHFPSDVGSFATDISYRDSTLEIKDAELEGRDASGVLSMTHNFQQDRIKALLEIHTVNSEDTALTLEMNGPRLEPNIKVNGAWLAP